MVRFSFSCSTCLLRGLANQSSREGVGYTKLGYLIESIRDKVFDIQFSHYCYASTCRVSTSLSAFQEQRKPPKIWAILFEHMCLIWRPREGPRIWKNQTFMVLLGVVYGSSWRLAIIWHKSPILYGKIRTGIHGYMIKVEGWSSFPLRAWESSHEALTLRGCWMFVKLWLVDLQKGFDQSN